MKLSIEQNPDLQDTEVSVRCPEITPEITELLDTIRLFGNTISGKKDNSVHFVNLADILYFETNENRLFFYTVDSIFEASLRLYEIEERFKNTSFVRVSKSFILNLRKVKSIRTESNGRMMAELVNRENIVISRQYVQNIKQKLGL